MTKSFRVIGSLPVVVGQVEHQPGSRFEADACAPELLAFFEAIGAVAPEPDVDAAPAAEE